MWFNIMFHFIRRFRENIRRLTKQSLAVQVDAAVRKSLFIKLLMHWKKTTGQTINQMILQGKDVCMKDLTVPTVQLKLLNFIYLS